MLVDRHDRLLGLVREGPPRRWFLGGDGGIEGRIPDAIGESEQALAGVDDPGLPLDAAHEPVAVIEGVGGGHGGARTDLHHRVAEGPRQRDAVVHEGFTQLQAPTARADTQNVERERITAQVLRLGGEHRTQDALRVRHHPHVGGHGTVGDPGEMLLVGGRHPAAGRESGLQHGPHLAELGGGGQPQRPAAPQIPRQQRRRDEAGVLGIGRRRLGVG